MDTRTNGSAARNGGGLYPYPLVLEESKVVACVDPGPAQRCPYGLGTNCPLVEVAKGVVWRRRVREYVVGLALGMAISALAVWLVYF